MIIYDGLFSEYMYITASHYKTVLDASQLITGSHAFSFIFMSHIMRKPVYAICEQQRARSACTSAQSDQHLCFRCLDNISLVSTSEIASLYLASVAA